MESFLTSLPTTVVIDHMACPDLKKGLDHVDFQRFLRLLETHGKFYCKVTCPERFSIAGPPYDDVVPFARTIVERIPDRVFWGTDWPHPNTPKAAPDDGVIVDMIPKIAPSPALQQALLIDNPMQLYWT